MNLPYVKIAFQNGQLGITEPTADGVCGLVPNGTVVVARYEEQRGGASLITSLSDITETGTDALTYQMIREFYAEAGDGALLWVLGDKPTTPQAGVTSLQEAANGACRCIGVVTALSSTEATLKTSLAAINKAAEDLTTSIFAPVFVVCGIASPANLGSLVDITTVANNRVAVIVGNEVTGVTATDTTLATSAAVGLLLGRIAKNAVQTSVAKVSDGAVKGENFAFGTAAITNTGASTASTKGYITLRTWTGKAGFFFSTDTMATVVTDDYGMIPRRRTIDKAYRVTYKALLEEVGSEIPVSADGTIPTATAKAIEAAVETALEQNMTNTGNLGIDPEDDADNGVLVYVNPKQNVVASNKLEVSVKVKPYAYAYYIEANLSFYTNE